MKKVLLLSSLLANLSFAGTMINSPVNNSNNPKGISYKNKGGKVYNDKIIINHITSNNTKTNKTDKSSNNINSKTKNNNFSADLKTNVNGLQKFLTDIVY